jgi:hypothetical protein
MRRFPNPRVSANLLVSLCLLAGVTTGVRAQDHQHAAPREGVGRVAFPVSCSESAKPRFERAVAMLHSFWFEAAEAEFQSVLQADATCAMAHWGVAMTMLGNPFTRVAPPEPRLQIGLASARQALELAASASERERLYARAALALYEDAPAVPHAERMKRHEAAMQELADRFPEDPEARIFLGRAIVANAPPEDLTFARQLHAAQLLEPLFAQMPEHPGLAHYIIHAFDAPAIADHGLAAARRYAEIAPDAPHALHMPSHIFTRLGHWDESIELNRRSAWAEPDSNAAVHPMDYMVYAYLQQGRDTEARAVVRRAVQNPDRFYGGLLGYNFAAMPARFALEREAWADAVALNVPEGASPYVEAIPRFARAIGAARGGQPTVAADETAHLASLRDALKEAGDSYWATIVGAQHLAASAWLAHAHGNEAEAVRLAGEAAELEETVEKHPVTPGPLLPARELEGDLLLELSRPAEALAAYERTLEREPRRARTLFGAARAAELAGKDARARQHYTELLEVMRDADGNRPEPAAARAFLAQGR